MKIAYLVTRNATNELLNGCLLTTLSKGRHHAEVVAMHFCEDGVYHLVRGSDAAGKIEKAAERGTKILACACSVENRGLKRLLLAGATIAHLPQFYRLCEESGVEHIITV